MTPAAVAAMVLEIAVGIAAQASGIGGPYVVGGALLLVVFTIAFLVVQVRRRPSLAQELRRFVKEWGAAQPSGDSRARRRHELDMLECFRGRHATAVSETARRLRDRDLIGKREARRWNNPKSLREIEAIAERLAALESHPAF